MSSSSQQTSFLPDFCGTRIVFVVIILAELLAIVLTLVQPPGVEDRLSELAYFSMFAQWIALSCVAALCLCRRWLDRLSDMWLASVSYLVTLLTSLVITELAWWILSDWPAVAGTVISEHLHFLFKSMGISAIVSALMLRYFYVRHQWSRRIKSESESRFQALQSRIRPHFLFNCMNTIASLTRRSPELAEQVIEDLSDMFRVTLGDASSPGTLEDEFELCRRYLRIEKQRLGDRLNIQWSLEDLPADVTFPVLCLQPLLENAIYHGIELLPEGGTIRISARQEGRYIRITISNPVPATDPDNQSGNRLAQENVSERLGTLFNQDDLLEFSRDDNHYLATVRVPYPYEDIDS